MMKDWLWQLFESKGKITNIYLSKKKRRPKDCPFGLVSFMSRGGAYRAIYNLNEMEIRGSKIIVKEYSRSGVFWNFENRETFVLKEGQISSKVMQVSEIGKLLG